MLLWIVFVLSSFLDNIAAALIGGTMANVVFRGKVHIGYLAAIVAASNAGGSGSVVGDTTTTMMWIAGVSPLDVFEAYIAAVVATAVCGVIAARQQHAYAPISAEPPPGIHVDWARVAIVAFILAAAIVANVVCNLYFKEVLDQFPVIGVAVWAAILLTAPVRRPEWSLHALHAQGHHFPAVAGHHRLHDAGRKTARRLVAFRPRTGLRLGGVRQYSADRAGAQAGRLRLGLPRLRRRLRRVDDLVRLKRRCRDRPTMFPQARSVGLWLRHGWHVALAYVVGFFVLLAVLGWHPNERLKKYSAAEAHVVCQAGASAQECRRV